jgi:DNA polymerase (family 10)
MHTTESDGRETVEAMAAGARHRGLEYIAVTEHSKSLVMANGLDEARTLAHAARVRRLDQSAGVRVLAGVECDIRPDGTLDLADDCLAALDLVVASVHSAFNQDRQQMTERLLRAIENPHVDILGHLTGRLILRRPPYPLDIEAIVEAAARHTVALEINSQVDRLDVNDTFAKLAKERGVRLVISSDAHSCGELAALRWGVTVARRAWLEPGHVLNTRPFEGFKAGLRRHAR